MMCETLTCVSRLSHGAQGNGWGYGLQRGVSLQFYRVMRAKQLDITAMI